jgi:hypothetical protein
MSEQAPREDIASVAEQAIGEAVRHDAAALRRALPLLSHGMIAGVLASHLAGTGVLAGIVFSEPFPYPLMYVLMGVLLWLTLVIRFTAWAGGRRVSAFLLMLANLLGNAFWIAILADQVAGRPVVTGRVEARLDLPWLWLPIGLYALAMATMVAHAVIHRRRGRTP